MKVFLKRNEEIAANENTKPHYQAEYLIFEENLNEFIETMRAEINIALYKWDFILQDREVGGLNDQYINKRLNKIKLDMIEYVLETTKNYIDNLNS